VSPAPPKPGPASAAQRSCAASAAFAAASQKRASSSRICARGGRLGGRSATRGRWGIVMASLAGSNPGRLGAAVGARHAEEGDKVLARGLGRVGVPPLGLAQQAAERRAHAQLAIQQRPLQRAARAPRRVHGRLCRVRVGVRIRTAVRALRMVRVSPRSKGASSGVRLGHK